MNESAGLRKELLGVEEVAEYLGVKAITVYRWCKEERLPCLKIGKHWRIRREALEDFVRRAEQPITLVGQLRLFVRVPDRLIGVAQNLDLMHQLDAAFFQVGEAQGGFLVKFYSGEVQSEDELRANFKRNGLAIERLEEQGRFLMRPEREPLGERKDELRRLLKEEVDTGRILWASFDWAKQIDLDTALRQQEALAQLIGSRQLVLKTTVLEEAAEYWTPAMLGRAQGLTSGMIWLSEAGLSLCRVTQVASSG